METPPACLVGYRKLLLQHCLIHCFFHVHGLFGVHSGRCSKSTRLPLRRTAQNFRCDSTVRSVETRGYATEQMTGTDGFEASFPTDIAHITRHVPQQTKEPSYLLNQIVSELEYR